VRASSRRLSFRRSSTRCSASTPDAVWLGCRGLNGLPEKDERLLSSESARATGDLSLSMAGLERGSVCLGVRKTVTGVTFNSCRDACFPVVDAIPIVCTSPLLHIRAVSGAQRMTWLRKLTPKKGQLGTPYSPSRLRISLFHHHSGPFHAVPSSVVRP
jgi:hypothetical protein